MGEIYPEDNTEREPIKQQKFKRSSLQVLEAYGTNITKLATEGKLDPVIGREDEILRVIQIHSF